MCSPAYWLPAVGIGLFGGARKQALSVVLRFAEGASDTRVAQR